MNPPDDHPSEISIVGIGAATVDVISVVERFPADDGVQESLDQALTGGGPVATALCAASTLGCTVALVDCIGDDWAGKHILQSLRASGVRTDLIEIDGGSTSSVSSILVRRSDAARAIAFKPATSREPVVSEATIAAIASSRILHMNGRHPEACRAAIRVANQHDTRLSFDGGSGRYRSEIDDILEAAHYPIVSLDFATALTGIKDPESAVRELATLPSAEFAVVTAGDKGSWLAEGTGQPVFCPAFKLPQTSDTTGAGDVYHGAFLSAIASFRTLEDAQRFASAAAAISTTMLGGRAALSGIAAVEALLYGEFQARSSLS